MTSTDQALAAWGAYDRDDPFPLFEASNVVCAAGSCRSFDASYFEVVLRFDTVVNR